MINLLRSSPMLVVLLPEWFKTNVDNQGLNVGDEG